jgi:glycosyltransferase involved in cell wall biosynthesis
MCLQMRQPVSMDPQPCSVRPMNVMFIIYDLERGGPEMRLLDLAEHLPPDIRMFISVTSAHVSLLDRFTRCGVDVDVIPIGRAYAEPGKIKSVVRRVRANQIQVVNTFDVKGLLIALCIKWFSGRSVIVVHHVVDMLRTYTSRQRAALRWLLTRVDRVITNSRAARDLLAGGLFPEERIELIHNGVDLVAFDRGRADASSLRRQLGIPDDALVVGTVANFRKEKEYPFLIDAFSQLAAARPELRLLCVGGGPLLDDMRRLAAERGIADRTVFTGYVENVPDHLGAMDVFVLTGSNEGFPNALVQAMSMELPVVAPAVGGCVEIVEHGTDGFLFDPGDRDGFVETLTRIVEDRQLASVLALEGKHKAQASFGLTKMIDRYFDYFRMVARAAC